MDDPKYAPAFPFLAAVDNAVACNLCGAVVPYSAGEMHTNWHRWLIAQLAIANPSVKY